MSDPGTWIADTGSTVQNTPHSVGMIKLMKGGSEDSVNVENGQKVESSKVGSIT